MNRDTLIRARGCGDRVYRNGALIPGPGEPDHRRNLLVVCEPHGDRPYRYTSFIGQDHRQVMDYIDGLLGRAFKPGARPVEPTPPRPQLVHSAEPDKDAEIRKARALELWDQARPMRGTPGEAWLNGRGIELHDDVDNTVLRFHPRCPWKGDDGRKILVPAMIALFRNIQTDERQAIHRTRLDVKARKTLAPIAGAAIKLDPDDAVTHGLTIGEGIETTLAARQMGLKPAWALGSTSGIAKFGPLSGIEALTILGENDATGANARASNDCARLWRGSGAEVTLLQPKVGSDANDVLRMGGARG